MLLEVPGSPGAQVLLPLQAKKKKTGQLPPHACQEVCRDPESEQGWWQLLESLLGQGEAAGQAGVLEHGVDA